MIVPYIDVVHNRSCSNCSAAALGAAGSAGRIHLQAGKERTPERLIDLADKLEESSGYGEISLSLSTSDWGCRSHIGADRSDGTQDGQPVASVPPYRFVSLDLMEKVQKVRRAGSHLLRGGHAKAQGRHQQGCNREDRSPGKPSSVTSEAIL